MITYDLQLDLNRDGTFSNAVGFLGNRVLSANWALGMSDSFIQMSQPLLWTVIIHDPDLDFSQDVGSSPFGQLLKDMLVRLRATVEGQTTRTLVTGWITDVQSHDRESGAFSILTIEDRTLQLQDAEYLPTFSTDTRVDVEIQNVFDTAILAYPYLKSYWILDASRLDIDTFLFEENFTELEIALTTLAFAGDAADSGHGVSALGYIGEILQAEKGGRFFVNRIGKFEFHNRFHDVEIIESTTFTSDDFINFLLVQGDVFNDITINYVPRSLGGVGVVLFSAKNLPFIINPLNQRTIIGRYYSTDILGTTVGGKDVIAPVADTDYIAIATTGGAPRTNTLRYNFEIGGTAINILIDNPTDESITITKLQVRGTPVQTFQQEQVNSINVASIFKYGRIPFPTMTMAFVNSGTIAQPYADQLGQRYAEPTQRYETVDFIIGSLDKKLDDLAERVLSTTIGDAVVLVNDVTGHNREYAMVGERHTLDGNTHRVQWVLRPTDRTKVWILNQSALDTETILAF